jgi:hypothetical protein
MEEINQVCQQLFHFLIIKASLIYNYIPQCVIRHPRDSRLFHHSGETHIHM